MKRRAFLAALLTSPALAGGLEEAKEQIRSGSFTSGRTTGSVQMMQIDGQWIVRLGEDFDHEGSPDPWVALGANGFRRDAQLGPLRANTGTQVYPLGPRDPSDFNEVWIWCQRFSTPLGRARLSPGG